MAEPDKDCILFFPFGGGEYDQCKAARSQLAGTPTKTLSKVATYLKGARGADLVIVAHGKQTHSVGRAPKIYSEGGCFGHSKKDSNAILTDLTKLGDVFNAQTIGGIWLWVCYSSTSGLGVSVKNALRTSNIRVYATAAEIGGVGVWNEKGSANIGTHSDSFVLMV